MLLKNERHDCGQLYTGMQNETSLFASLKYLQQCQKHCSSLDYEPQDLQEFRIAAIYMYILPP